MEFNIVQDTREKQPLKFTESTTVKKLDTGDYSVVGLETKLCIERKASLSEFYGNVTKPRFWAELERMKSYPYRYLILEFGLIDIENFPYSLNLPKSVWSKLKVSPKYLLSCINKIQYDYEVIVLFADDRKGSTEIILEIMRRVCELEKI